MQAKVAWHRSSSRRERLKRNRCASGPFIEQAITRRGEMKRIVALAAGVATLAGCTNGSTSAPADAAITSATATSDLRSATGATMARATATQIGDSIRVKVEAAGMRPGTYGLMCTRPGAAILLILQVQGHTGTRLGSSMEKTIRAACTKEICRTCSSAWMAAGASRRQCRAHR
jgi:hypothetical protein